MNPPRRVQLRLVRDREHYEDLVMRVIAGAKVSVWIATANVKELRVEAPIGSRARAGGRYVSLLDLLEGLASRGVELRLLHSGIPSRAFRAELDAHATLRRGKLEMRRCPRVHMKMIAADGASLYLGSANLTGAGLGAKGDRRRNFEAGIITDDDVLLDEMQATFEAIWSGKHCARCALRAECPGPLDGLGRMPGKASELGSRGQEPKKASLAPSPGGARVRGPTGAGGSGASPLPRIRRSRKSRP